MLWLVSTHLICDGLLDEVIRVQPVADVIARLLQRLPRGALVLELILVHLALGEAPRVAGPVALGQQNLCKGRKKVGPEVRQLPM